MEGEGDIRDLDLIRDHRRQWRHCRYVYPVISRRSKGLSIGVNLNPDQACTLSCVYCQVRRTAHRGLPPVDLKVLETELRLAMEQAVSGRLWLDRRFAATPPGLRRINDIAFSGDGEPTCLENFDQAVAVAAAVRQESHRPDIKLIVLTNSSLLDRPQVRRALPVLQANNGEIWAKLDAGTEEYFRAVNRPAETLSLAGIVANIAAVARLQPVVIQTMLMRIGGRGPCGEEIAAYCARLEEILAAGGKIKLVQLHTVARRPVSESVSALPDEQLDAVAAAVRSRLPAVPVETYYGPSDQRTS